MSVRNRFCVTLSRGLGCLIVAACVGGGACVGNDDGEDGPSATWWTEGPAQDDVPPGMSYAQSSADTECEDVDPFSRMITCRPACHFALVEISNRSPAPNGNVMEMEGGYVVMDTTTAVARVDEYLTDAVYFDGAPFGTRPQGSFMVQEFPSGFMDIYGPGTDSSAPAYLRTLWSVLHTVPQAASLPESGLAVIGFRDAGDVIDPERKLVTLVLEVSADGLVDMSPFEGTMVTVSNGWPADTPTGAIALNVARDWFGQLLSYNGARCAQDEAEPPIDTLPPWR